LRCERGQFRGARFEEGRPQQQVLRRITAERKLRRDDQRRAGAFCLGRRRENAARVGGEIAHHLIELRDRDLHDAILPLARTRTPAGA
jgi:hypothetical protein